MSNIYLPYVLPRHEKVDPELKDAFSEMAQEYFEQTGEPLKVTDSFRTNEEQADLYKRKPTLAAPPGKSRHETGSALDVDQNQITKFGLDKWGELLNTHGFVRPALESKGETWHIELPKNPYIRAGKVAGTLANPYLDAGKVESSNPYLDSGVLESPKLPVSPELELDKDAPEISLEGLPEAAMSQVSDPIKTALGIVGAKAAGVVGTILGAPHEYIAKPFVEKPASALLEKLGVPETVSVPAESMIAGEAASLIRPEDLSGENIDASLRSLLPTALGGIADIPIYGKILKAANAIKSGVDAAKLARVPKGVVGEEELLSLLKSYTTPPAKTGSSPFSMGTGERGLVPQSIEPTEESLRQLGLLPTTPRAILDKELQAIEARARTKTPLALGEQPVLEPTIIPGEAALTTKPSTLPPEPTKIVAPTQMGAFAEATPITPSPRATVQVTPEGTKIVPTEIPTIGTGERGRLTKMYSGGPDTEDVARIARDIQEAAKQPGATYLSGLNQVASKLGVSSEALIESLRRGSLVRNNPAENIAAQMFPADKKVEDLKGFHKAHMEGVPTVKPGQVEFSTIGPSKIDSLVPTPKRNVSVGEAQVGPDTVSRNVFGDKNNLVGDYFQSVNHYRENTRAGWTVLDNLAAKTGLSSNIEASRLAVESELFPILDKYKLAVQGQREAYAQIQSKAKVLKQLDSTTPEAIRSEDEIALLRKQIQDTPAVKMALKERDEVVLKLAREHPNIRTFLAAEHPGMFALTSDEQLVVDNIRKYLDDTKVRLQSQGHRTFGFGGKEYMPYVYTGTNDTSWFLGQRQGYAEFMDFLSRTPGSESWFPLTYQSMRQYIPTVEKKLALNPLTRKWTPAINSWKNGDFPGTADWAKGFLDANLAPERMDAIDKVISFAVGTEYARTLWGNLAPPLLHLFKVVGNVGYQGMSALKGGKDFATAVAQKIAKTPGVEAEILDHYLMGKELMTGVYQNKGLDEMLKATWWQKIKGTINLPLQLSEYVGNGLNVFSSIARGIKAGAPAETINREVLESMLRLDYRGFVMPPALTERKLKPLTMYMGQPTKRVENLADIGAKGIMEAVNTIGLKTGLIDKAIFNVEPNMFGESYLPKFVRMMALLGITQQAGKYYGVDLSKHVFHLPASGYARETGESTLSLQTPLIELASQLSEKGLGEGLRQHYGWAAPAKFFQTPISKFDENYWMQIFGVPKYGWQEEMQSKKALRNIKEKLQHPFRSMQKTPIEKILGGEY